MPWPWRPEQSGRGQAGGHGADVVGGGQLDGSIPARLVDVLVAEQTEGQHDDVEVAAGRLAAAAMTSS